MDLLSWILKTCLWIICTSCTIYYHFLRKSTDNHHHRDAEGRVSCSKVVTTLHLQRSNVAIHTFETRGTFPRPDGHGIGQFMATCGHDRGTRNSYVAATLLLRNPGTVSASRGVMSRALCTYVALCTFSTTFLQRTISFFLLRTCPPLLCLSKRVSWKDLGNRNSWHPIHIRRAWCFTLDLDAGLCAGCTDCKTLYKTMAARWLRKIRFLVKLSILHARNTGEFEANTEHQANLTWTTRREFFRWKPDCSLQKRCRQAASGALLWQRICNMGYDTAQV